MIFIVLISKFLVPFFSYGFSLFHPHVW